MTAETDDLEAFLYTELAAIRNSTPKSVVHEVANDGEIDSLEGVGLIAAAEERFGIRIEDRELTSELCRSIQRLSTLIASKIERSVE